MGPFKNPTEGWKVIPNPNDDVGGYVIGVPITDKELVEMMRYNSEGAQRLLQERDKNDGYRLHTNGKVFQDEDDAHEYVNHLEEFYERDYDDYLEENHVEIARMERYEMWRNEY